MEIVSVLLVLVALMLGVIGVAVVVHELACPATEQQRLQQRTRDAEREITDVSRRTQEAIIAELIRRTGPQHRTVEGQVLGVEDEPGKPRW